MQTQISGGAPRRINWSIIVSLLMLALIFFGARYAVTHWRRPGSMGVIEAQAMDMTVMKPPVGAVPVAVYKAQRGSVQTKVTYTGSAVAWTNQEIAARVTGRIVEMPVYPGARVRRGQLLARLDSDELRSREAEARSAQLAAAHDRMIAAAAARQAAAMRRQAQAEAARERNGIRETQSGVAGSQAMVQEALRAQDAAREGVRDAQAAQEVARRGVIGAQADVVATQREADTRAAEIDDARAAHDDSKSEVESAQALVEQAKARLPQAQSEVDAARADAKFQSEKVKRSAQLFKQGAISREELQQDEAVAQAAEAKVKQALARADEVRGDINEAQAGQRQAQAKVRGAEARIRAAQGNAEAAKARVEAAQAKVAQMQSEVERAAVAVRQRNAEVAMAAARIGRSRADVAVASAKVAQAQDAARSAQEGAQAAAAGTVKAGEEIVHAELIADQAQDALTTARVIRGYTEIRAATEGVVTERVVAPGSLVNAGTTILRVSQIGTIRFQANVAQSDLDLVRVGTPVTIRAAADAKKRLQTVVSAVFPAADPQSRTGIVEAVAPNVGERFKPGEFIAMDITTSRGAGGLKVPSGAIVLQSEATDDIIATRQASLLWTMIENKNPGQPIYTCTMHPQIREDHPGDCPICHMKLTPLVAGGKYIAQQVKVQTGATDGEWTEITGGLPDGAQIIFRGYENLKNGDAVLPEGEAAELTTANQEQATHQAAKSNLQTVNIIVKGTGFEPSQVTLKAGIPARLVFKRIEEQGCGTEVLFPDLKIKKTLPLNQAVPVEFTPNKSASLSFSCGMDMLKGTVIVR